jgi:uncharacterized damage-inducible protein DinB
MDEKAILRHYLGDLHEAVRWKVTGLGERDLRRPLTPTGTNILGLVKHLASIELDYLGPVFGRPHGVVLPWYADDAEDNADMWVTPEESTESILALYDRAWQHTTRVLDELPLDAEGHVPWWRTNPVTLRRVLVHVLVETARHAGHIDVVRELVDGQAGWLPGNENLPDRDRQWWADYVRRVQEAADQF